MEILTKHQKRALIARAELFRNIDEAHLDEVASYSRVKQFKTRDIICQKGDPGTQMYVIASGRVTMNTESDEGKELAFGMLGPGDIFGEIALLDGDVRTVSIKAMEPTQVVIIQRRDFIPFLEKNPGVAISLLATIAARLRATDELFEDTFFRNLEGRLAKRFLGLAETYGEETHDGVKITVKLSQGDISKLAGATRESINRQMKAWEEEGLISSDQGRITLKQPKVLESLCEY